MAGFEELFQKQNDRLRLLEKQMKNMINHCNKATSTVQRLVWDMHKLQDGKDGTTKKAEPVRSDDCEADCIRGR